LFGRILRIDLSEKKYTKEKLEEEFIRKYDV
jgi:aldehyde:ferredoxin oxidoreductase